MDIQVNNLIYDFFFLLTNHVYLYNKYFIIYVSFWNNNYLRKILHKGRNILKILKILLNITLLLLLKLNNKYNFHQESNRFLRDFLD